MQAYGILLLFALGGLLFLLGGLFTSWLVRPHAPNPEKGRPYESGEEPQGSGWGQFNVRYYVVALVFILFEVEIIFMVPWAVVYARPEWMAETQNLWGWFALSEMVLFVGILGLGLAYVWRMGYLGWVRPRIEVLKDRNPVPEEVYEAVNQELKQR